MSTFKLPGRKPGLSDQHSVLLCAHLTREDHTIAVKLPNLLMPSIPSTEVNVIGELEKRGPSRRPDHFVVVQVNEREVVKSEKKYRTPAPSWREVHQL